MADDTIGISLAPFLDHGTQKYGVDITISGLHGVEHVDLVLQVIRNAFALLDPTRPESTTH